MQIPLSLGQRMITWNRILVTTNLERKKTKTSVKTRKPIKNNHFS